MRNFDILLWDVDQTLLDFTKSEDYALRYSFRQFGMEIDTNTVLLYAGINNSYWKRLEKGEVSKNEVLLGRFETLFQKLSLDSIKAEAFAPIYQKALGSVYFYRDDSYELCRKLKGSIRQFIVTNGVTATQQNKLRLSGLDKLMEKVFISEQLGSPKPSRDFFDKCFEQIPDFDKERTIIVGDSLSSDMLGANNAGIRACWYNPNKDSNDQGVLIDYEIRNLWEVCDIL